MAATNLIIALVFAGIFGAALIYVALWFIHRYIHQRCYEFEHWFHFLFPGQSRPPRCVYIEKAEEREPSNHRLRSAKREQGRSGRSQTRKYHEDRDRESNRARDAYVDPSRPRDVERARLMIQFNTPTQPQQQQPYGQSYYPSLGQEQWPGTNQVGCSPQIQQQIPMPWQAQGVAHMPPFAMPTAVPQQPFPQMAARMPKPLQYRPQYQTREQPHFRQPYTGTINSDVPKANQRRTPPTKSKSPGRRARRVEKVDFIHICDEYPPIVLEALKKATPQSSSSSSSSSSAASSTTQEVPRVPIPQAAPGFADTLPFEFPRYPHTAMRVWNTPRSYPRQWNRDPVGVDGPDTQARYAPFTPMSGYTARPWGLHTDRRDSAPSNAHHIPLLVPRLKTATSQGAYADVCCRV
jgi:hypothetical protein